MWLRRVGPVALAPPMRIRRESIDAYWEEEGHIEVVLTSGWQMAVAGDISEFDKAMSLKPASSSNEPLSRDDMDDFEEFYRRYPRKMKKPDAQKAWHQLRDERPSLAVLLQALEHHVDTWKREGREVKVVPYPASWLRNKQWGDQCEGRNGLRAVAAPTVSDMLVELDQLDNEAPF